MVKRIAIITAALALFAAAGAGIGLRWVLGTPQGFSWVLETVSRLTSVQIIAERIDGCLGCDNIGLKALRVQWLGGSAKIDSAVLRWTPAALIRGRLHIDSLDLDKVTVKLPETGKTGSSEFTWPKVPGPALRVEADVRSLKISEFCLETDGQPIRVDDFSTRLSWKQGVFTAVDLAVGMPEIQVSGQIAAGFVKPALDLEAKAILSRPAAGFDAFLIEAEMKAGKSTSVFPATLGLTAIAGDISKIKASARLSLRENGLEISEALITHPDQGTIQIQGKLDWDPLYLDMQAGIRGLNLFPETGVVTALTGAIEVQGVPAAWQGHFSLQNRVESWLRAEAAANFTGNLKQITLTDLKGLWLDGTLAGSLSADWDRGMVETVLKGRNLDLSKAESRWDGRVNLDLSGHLTLPESGPQAEIQAELLESVFMGKSLTGTADAKIDGDRVDIRQLDAAGEGFRISAAGKLDERLNLSVRLDDLGLWVEEARGRVIADGWIRRLDQWIGGELQARGEDLFFQGLSIDSLSLTVGHADPRGGFTLKAGAGNILYREYRLESCGIGLEGLLEDHRGALDLKWPDGNLRLKAAGGFHDQIWSGNIHDLALRDAVFGDWILENPVKIQAGSEEVSVSPARFLSPGRESAVLDGAYSHSSGQGFVNLKWQELNLSRLDDHVPPLSLTGKSSGEFHGTLESEGDSKLEGALKASGTIASEKLPSTAFSASAQIRWNEEGLAAGTRISLAEGVELTADFSGPALEGLRPPGQVRIDARWQGVDLSMARPWLDEAFDAEGRLSGDISGTWFSNQVLDLSGHAALEAGRVSFTMPETGLIAAELQTARLNWQWRGNHLSGDALLTLADYGQARARFQVPVPAAIPVRFSTGLPFEATLSCQMKEQGLLSAIFPGMVQESQGDLNLNADIGGTLESPKFSGVLELDQAGGYFPQAGIHIQDAGLKSRFSEDRLVIESLYLSSGKGRLQGDGEVRLDHWRVGEYRFHISGENFQVVNLPELQLRVKPDLQIRGTGAKARIEGEVTVTDALVSERRTQAPVVVSEDVRIVDAALSPEERMPLDIEAKVKVIFGDHVLVKAVGVDARLGGNAIVTIQGTDDIKAIGEISVVKGAYAAYGVKLNIERGRVIFAGPMEQATLDVLAIRTVEEVRAGVRVTGTVQKPVAKLYSSPAMSETDALAYVVLGRPMGQDGGQIDLLMVTARALLSKGDSAALQDRLQRRLGLDVIEIQGGSGDVTASMVTVGKYFSPKLYISLGHALFTGSNEFRMRYSISKSWEVESNFGEQSGADLFYKIEFK